MPLLHVLVTFVGLLFLNTSSAASSNLENVSYLSECPLPSVATVLDSNFDNNDTLSSILALAVKSILENVGDLNRVAQSLIKGIQQIESENGTSGNSWHAVVWNAQSDIVWYYTEENKSNFVYFQIGFVKTIIFQRGKQLETLIDPLSTRKFIADTIGKSSPSDPGISRTAILKELTRVVSEKTSGATWFAVLGISGSMAIQSTLAMYQETVARDQYEIVFWTIDIPHNQVIWYDSNLFDYETSAELRFVEKLYNSSISKIEMMELMSKRYQNLYGDNGYYAIILTPIAVWAPTPSRTLVVRFASQYSIAVLKHSNELRSIESSKVGANKTLLYSTLERVIRKSIQFQPGAKIDDILVDIVSQFHQKFGGQWAAACGNTTVPFIYTVRSLVNQVFIDNEQGQRCAVWLLSAEPLLTVTVYYNTMPQEMHDYALNATKLLLLLHAGNAQQVAQTLVDKMAHQFPSGQWHAFIGNEEMLNWQVHAVAVNSLLMLAGDWTISLFQSNRFNANTIEHLTTNQNLSLVISQKQELLNEHALKVAAALANVTTSENTNSNHTSSSADVFPEGYPDEVIIRNFMKQFGSQWISVSYKRGLAGIASSVGESKVFKTNFTIFNGEIIDMRVIELEPINVNEIVPQHNAIEIAPKLIQQMLVNQKLNNSLAAKNLADAMALKSRYTNWHAIIGKDFAIQLSHDITYLGVKVGQSNVALFELSASIMSFEILLANNSEGNINSSAANIANNRTLENPTIVVNFNEIDHEVYGILNAIDFPPRFCEEETITANLTQIVQSTTSKLNERLGHHGWQCVAGKTGEFEFYSTTKRHGEVLYEKNSYSVVIWRLQ